MASSVAARFVALATVAALAVPGTVVASPDSVMPFVENDYAAALARAKKENKPLFVDVWAPW
jgi:hypothetical protein